MSDNYVTTALSGSGYAHVVVTISALRSVIITRQQQVHDRWQEALSHLPLSWCFLRDPLLSSFAHNIFSNTLFCHLGSQLVQICQALWSCDEVVMLWESGLGPALAVTSPGVAHALNINTRRDHSFRNEFSVILLKVSKTRCILLDEEYEGLFFGTILIQNY